MAKDEELLRRAAEFRAIRSAHNGRLHDIRELWDERRIRAADKRGWLVAYRESLAPLSAACLQIVTGLRGGAPSALEPALVFLETRPRFHGSGYYAEDIIRLLLRDDSLRADTARIRSVCLAMLDDGPSRELRMVANLASTVWSPELDAEVESRIRAASDVSTVRRVEFFRDQALARRSTFSGVARAPRQAAQTAERQLRRWREARIRKMSRRLRDVALIEYGSQDPSPEYMSGESARVIASRVLARIESGIEPSALAAAITRDVAELHGPVNNPGWQYDVVYLSEVFFELTLRSDPRRRAV